MITKKLLHDTEENLQDNLMHILGLTNDNDILNMVCQEVINQFTKLLIELDNHET